MNRCRIILIGVFAALFSFSSPIFGAATAWQYGTFSELDGQFNYSWQDGEKYLGASDFAEFADKLANAGVIASGAKPKTFVALLDMLGAQGWELVTVTQRGTAAVVRHFKRPSP